ncbi:MAG: hypothetical protein V2A70_06825 [Candidatus Omnitrophota bacterium]
MHIEIFTLCDAATSDHGKINILGSFDTIWVRQFPSVYPYCAVAVKMRFSCAEKGAHGLSVRFMDADGQNVLQPATGSFTVAMPQGQLSASADIILNIQSLNLAKPGEYSLVLSIDGQNLLSLPLYVRQAVIPEV